MRMHSNNSYHDENVHTNVQKALYDGMENVGVYTKEENNVLRKNSNKEEFTVRLHFNQETESKKIIEEVQKILTATYIENLIKGGK